MVVSVLVLGGVEVVGWGEGEGWAAVTVEGVEGVVVGRRRRLQTRRSRGGGRRRIKGAGRTITGGTSGRGRWRGVGLLGKGVHDIQSRNWICTAFAKA